MNRVVEQLRAARKLIEREDAWCKGTAARDASGQRVPFDEPSASAWCAVWALLKVGASLEAEQAVYQACGYGITAFNDDPHTLHTDVLATFDLAIASAKK